MIDELAARRPAKQRDPLVLQCAQQVVNARAAELVQHRAAMIALLAAIHVQVREQSHLELSPEALLDFFCRLLKIDAATVYARAEELFGTKQTNLEATR